MPKRNHRPYKYQDIKHSLDGVISCGLGTVSVLLIIGEFILSVRARGQAGGMAGFMGLSALFLAIVGFVFAVISWKDEETMDLFKRAGTLLNIILLIVNIIIIILGIFNW